MGRAAYGSVRAYTAQAESFSFCQELVQRSDVESFLCMPFVPAAARPSVLAVRAFNVEVAKAADKTSVITSSLPVGQDGHLVTTKTTRQT